MAIRNTLELDPARCYLSIHEREDGTFCLIDQEGRELAGVRTISPTFSFDEVTTCDVNFLPARASVASKYVNKRAK